MNLQFADSGHFSLSRALCVCHGLQLSSGDLLCLRSNSTPHIFHCSVNQVDNSNQEIDVIRFNLVDLPDGFPLKGLENESFFNIEVMARGQSFRRMTGKL